MKHLFEVWQRFVEAEESSPELQAILDQLGDLSLRDISVLWRATAAAHKQKENELKAGFKKGDRVAFDHEGEEITATVLRKGGKYVSIQPDGDRRVWKRWASELRKIE